MTSSPGRGDSESADEQSFERLFDRVTDAFFGLNTDWEFTYLNDRAEEVLDRDAAELVGTNVWEAFPEAADSLFQAEYERAMETQESAPFEAYYPPLSTWFAVRAYPSETGLSVYFRDVTERKERERQLRTRMRQLEAVAEVGQRALVEDDLTALMDEATVADVLDADYCKVLKLRPEREELLLRAGVGWEEGVVGTATVGTERTSQAGYTLLSDDPVVVEDLAGETRFEGPDLLTDHDVVSGVSVVVGSTDDPWGILGVHSRTRREFGGHDVSFVQSVAHLLASAISRTEREVELRAQNDRLETFASMLAHELRNPLNVAQMYLPDDASRDTARVREALDRMDGMIDSLLVMARGGRPPEKREAVDLGEVTADAWEAVAAPRATLRVETDRTILAEPMRLRRLFVNLFRNAVEHGGEDVTVRVDDVEDGFCVADDGPGVPASERESVFDLGYTTSSVGIGLGLTFVAQFADNYGWTYALTESADGGARFEFTDVDFADE